MLSGQESSVFRPKEAITRFEMVEMLVKAVESQPRRNYETQPVIEFNDTKTMDPVDFMYIAKASSMGIVSGTPEGNFEAYGLLNREQAAKVIYQFREITQ